jgi:hypothetical protein
VELSIKDTKGAEFTTIPGIPGNPIAQDEYPDPGTR